MIRHRAEARLATLSALALVAIWLGAFLSTVGR